MFQRTRIPAFAIAFVAVAQLNIRRTLMIKTNPSKCKTLIIRSKNLQIPIYKSCLTERVIRFCAAIKIRLFKKMVGAASLNDSAKR
jgi:hypothetical protein